MISEDLIDSLANSKTIGDFISKANFSEDEIIKLLEKNRDLFKYFRKEDITEKIILFALTALYNVEYVPFWNQNILDACTDIWCDISCIPKRVQTVKFTIAMADIIVSNGLWSKIKLLKQSDKLHEHLLKKDISNWFLIKNPSDKIKNMYRTLTL